MSTVYVLNKDGKPLMPTTRGGHVRHLLKEQKARVVRTKPFTIQLLYETDDVVQLLRCRQRSSCFYRKKSRCQRMARFDEGDCGAFCP